MISGGVIGVGVEDFADYIANVPVPSALGHIGGFLFRHIDLVQCFSALRNVTSNTVVTDSFLLSFSNYCFHLFVLMCCMF
jgi:hypothetical protein